MKIFFGSSKLEIGEIFFGNWKEVENFFLEVGSRRKLFLEVGIESRKIFFGSWKFEVKKKILEILLF